MLNVRAVLLTRNNRIDGGATELFLESPVAAGQQRGLEFGRDDHHQSALRVARQVTPIFGSRSATGSSDLHGNVCGKLLAHLLRHSRTMHLFKPKLYNLDPGVVKDKLLRQARQLKVASKINHGFLRRDFSRLGARAASWRRWHARSTKPSLSQLDEVSSGMIAKVGGRRYDRVWDIQH